MMKLKLKFKSLTMRIWTTFTVVILIIVSSISIFYLATFKLIDEKDKIQYLKASHEFLLNNKNFTAPDIGFREIRNLKDSESFLYRDGKIINISPKKDMMKPPQFEGAEHDEKKHWMASFIDATDLNGVEFKEKFKGEDFIFIISSITDENGNNVYLISYSPIMQNYDLIYTVVSVGFIFIAIGFLAAKVIANYIAKPLKELEDYTVRIAQKDWNEPISFKSDDEIGRLASSMNHMRRELKRAEEEEKMFLQSISHDLKTPVMVIMSHADAIIDGVYIDSVEKTAEIIRDEAVSLEKKIKQMLYLNTLDYVLDNNNEKIQINLKKLMYHIVNRFEVINNKIEWEVEIEDALINANVEKVQVAVENILDNGLRYAEGKVKVSLKKEGNLAVIEIYNDGPHIKDTHIGRIFDNLYKDKTGNFGLGLAISKKIIDFYGGNIKAINREKGVSFIIKFPLDQQ